MLHHSFGVAVIFLSLQHFIDPALNLMPCVQAWGIRDCNKSIQFKRAFNCSNERKIYFPEQIYGEYSSTQPTLPLLSCYHGSQRVQIWLRLQAPHMSKRQLLSWNKTPIQGVERRGYLQQGRCSNKIIKTGAWSIDICNFHILSSALVPQAIGSGLLSNFESILKIRHDDCCIKTWVKFLAIFVINNFLVKFERKI